MKKLFFWLGVFAFAVTTVYSNPVSRFMPGKLKFLTQFPGDDDTPPVTDPPPPEEVPIDGSILILLGLGLGLGTVFIFTKKQLHSISNESDKPNTKS